MSFDIYLYSIDKKHNSTKVPTNGTKFECAPRHAMSVLTPTVVVTGDDMTAYNYAYIPRYHRYYWINNIVCNSVNQWSLSMSCDVLATYKATIANATEYVARSASAYDGRISDSMYIGKSGAKIARSEIAHPFIDNIFNGTFIVGIINDMTSISSTAVTYYAMTNAQYGRLLRALQNQTAMADILKIAVSASGVVEGTKTVDEAGAEIIEPLTGCLQNITYDVYVSQLNPIQYIVSSVYFPVPMSALDTASSINIKLGKWLMKDGDGIMYARTVGYRVVLDDLSFTVPKHPNASDRGAYLNDNPYSTYSIHIPAFGVQSLDASRMCTASTISAKIVADSNTGNGYCFLNTNDATESLGALGILSGNIGISVPVTQLLATDLKGNLIANVAQIAGNVMQDAGGAMTTVEKGASYYLSALKTKALNFAQAFAPIFGGEVSNATISGAQAESDIAFDEYNRAKANSTPTAVFNGVRPIPTLSMTGSAGGSSALYGSAWLQNQYFELVAEDNETLGRPLMQVKTLGDLSGFIKCLDSHISTTGTSEETQAVNAYMTSGFFME